MPESSPKRIFPYGGVFLVSLVSACLIYATKAVWQNLHWLTWKPVSCVVERFEIRTEPRAGKDSGYAPDLSFRYEVAGQAFTGTRLWPGKSGRHSYEELSGARESLVAASFPNPAECRVSRWNPADAVLLPSPLHATTLVPATIMIGLMMGFGVCMIVSRLRQNRGVSKASADRLPAMAGALLMGGAGMTLSLSVLWNGFRETAAAKWPEAQATVISGRVAQWDAPKGGTHYRTDILYRYDYGGREFRSNRYDNVKGDADRAGKEQIVSAHPPGSSLVCRVNPEAPWQAIVDWSSEDHSGITLAFSSLVVVAAAVAAYKIRHQPLASSSARITSG